MSLADSVLDYILKLCVEAGLVDGLNQSIDSAYISANASINRMEHIKLVDRDHGEYLGEVFGQDLSSDISMVYIDMSYSFDIKKI